MSGPRIVCLATALLVARGAQAAPPEGGDIDMSADVDADAKPDDGAPVKDPKVAKKWLAAAKELVGKGDALAKKKPDDAKAAYENAVTAYTKAIEAGDDLGVNLQLAQVEDKLGRTDAAARHYRMVATAKAGVPPALVKQAQAKYDEAATKVGLVTLTVTPDGTTIASGAVKLGKTPLTEPLIFLPGTYTLTLSSDGYQSKDTELKVEAGSESERKLDLQPIKITVEAPPRLGTTDELPPEPTGHPSKLPMYIAAGAAGALLVTSVITGLTANSWHNTFVAPNTSSDERAFAHDAGRHWAHVTDACLVGGVLAGGFAAAWYVFKIRAAGEHPAETVRVVPKVDMIPWVQPDAGGLGFAGSF
jgi:hypothetical protein